MAQYTGWGIKNAKAPGGMDPFKFEQFQKSALKANNKRFQGRGGYERYLDSYFKHRDEGVGVFAKKKPARKAPTRRSQAKPDLFKELFG